MTERSSSGTVSLPDVQDLLGVQHGPGGRTLARLTVARMTAERMCDAGIPVKAIVLPPDICPGADTAYGYPILRADVLEPGVLA